MMDQADAVAQRGAPPWYEDEGWLREPAFIDVPFEQSGWKPIIEALERVNLAKARLLASIYEAQVRVAYQCYRAIRQEEEALFARERLEAEQRNDALRAQIRAIEQSMEQVRARWQPQLDALRERLYPAWRDAYEKAAHAGINLRGDPLMEDGLSLSASESPTSPSTISTAQSSPLTPSMEQNLPAPPSMPTQEPPSLTPAEVMHEHNLPSYQGALIPKPLWAVLVLVVGLGLGTVLAVALGLIMPGQPVGALFPVALALLAGVALTYLWTRALWGASAIVAELYHLFGWHESKARRAAWSIGIGLIVLMLTAVCWSALLISMIRAAPTTSGWLTIAMLITALTILPLLICALLEGFLEGRYKPIGHWIASRITQYEREQFQRKRETGDGRSLSSTDRGDKGEVAQGDSGSGETASVSPEGKMLSEVEREAWVAIRRYHALYRQYSHLKSEMEQELAPYREQIEQLKAEMRPLYPTLPPHSRNRIMLAYRQWEQMYHSYLHYLADALRECQGGEELATIVLERARNAQ